MSNTQQTKDLNTQVEDPNKPDAPKHEHGGFEAIKAKFSAHNAAPGPAVPKNFPSGEEGTKEERRAKAEQLNK